MGIVHKKTENSLSLTPVLSPRINNTISVQFLKQSIRKCLLWCMGLLSKDIKDCMTGEMLGRGFLLAWGGSVWLIGYRGRPLIARFLPQGRLTYWRQYIGFTTTEQPDFPRLVDTRRGCLPGSSRVINVVLTHLDGEHLARLRERWTGVCREEDLWIAFGGEKSRFESLGAGQFVYVGDGGIRRTDNQREMQSYTGIFQTMAPVIEREKPDFIYLCEYDHLPLRQDLNALQVAEMTEAGADVMGHFLARIDGTGHPHYLQHSSDPAFRRHWESVSLRENKGVVLTMFGSGSFWSRNAFLAVAVREQEIPCYVELYLPTLAHHLGYRVKCWDESRHLLSNLPSPRISERIALEKCCWTVHPVKE